MQHSQLRWLILEVHGRDIGRKPPTRSLGYKGPARSSKYRGWIRTLPCSACGIEGRSEAAHTGGDGGLRQKASDYSCIPLCPDCHTLGTDSYHQVGRDLFEQIWKIDCRAVVKRLAHDWFAYAGAVK